MREESIDVVDYIKGRFKCLFGFHEPETVHAVVDCVPSIDHGETVSYGARMLSKEICRRCGKGRIRSQVISTLIIKCKNQ